MQEEVKTYDNQTIQKAKGNNWTYVQAPPTLDKSRRQWMSAILHHLDVITPSTPTFNIGSYSIPTGRRNKYAIKCSSILNQGVKGGIGFGGAGLRSSTVCGICVKLGVPVMFDLLLYRIKGRFQKMDGHMCALPHETQPRKI